MRLLERNNHFPPRVNHWPSTLPLTPTQPLSPLLLAFFGWPWLRLWAAGMSTLSGSITCQPFAKSKRHQSSAE